MKIKFLNNFRKSDKCITLIVIVFTLIWMVSWDGRSLGRHEQQVVKALPSEQVDPEGWKSLFDGKTLTGWKIVRYGGEGVPYVKGGVMVLPKAVNGLMTGVCWVGDSLPVNNYVISYEARRVAGGDIFAGLTFRYGETSASLVFGGWGGIVNGLSSIDGYDASGNETTQFFSFRDNQWYPVQLRVTTDSIRAVVGIEKVVDLATAGKDIHLRDDNLDTGFTLWTYLSTGEIRNIRIKKLGSGNTIN